MTNCRKVASDGLLRRLGTLAHAMTRPCRTEQTKIKWRKDGRPAFQRGPNLIGLFNVEVTYILELGALLQRIAQGEDACELFRQKKHSKPSKRDEHEFRALAYWSIRALDPGARGTRAHALQKARDVIAGGADLSDSYIAKLAQNHRDKALILLEHGDSAGPVRFKGGKEVVYLRSFAQVAALREYLRKKSPRPCCASRQLGQNS